MVPGWLTLVQTERFTDKKMTDSLSSWPLHETCSDVMKKEDGDTVKQASISIESGTECSLTPKVLKNNLSITRYRCVGVNSSSAQGSKFTSIDITVITRWHSYQIPYSSSCKKSKLGGVEWQLCRQLQLKQWIFPSVHGCTFKEVNDKKITHDDVGK